MTITEMIEHLESLREQLGDTDVVIATDTITTCIDCITVDSNVVVIESAELIEDIQGRITEAYNNGVDEAGDLDY